MKRIKSTMTRSEWVDFIVLVCFFLAVIPICYDLIWHLWAVL